ncbi:paralemmin-3 [Pungitius pungitius]|uniref:paralemmin-3 n=1 Tax=Pungitius pungitius TaxID=134920 RepID=UPI002E0DAFCE
MDETEKYQQRLEAIAEKRRLQEEQDRARRDAEDEKLRQQQLKRKSLRDQWLMDKAPSSPTSPEAPSPRSPLWGPEAHEIEERIDRLQSESQRLAEEKEVHSEQTEDGQTEAVKEAEPEAEMVHCAVVQNGEHNGSDEVKTKRTQLEETGPLVNSSEASDDSRASTSGDVGDNMSELALSLGVFEAEPGQAPSVNFNPEGEGILVMRAERVIITDEGDEDLAHQKDTEEAGPEGVEAAEGEAETELAPETFTEPEKSEALEPAAEEQSAPGDSQAGVATDERCDGEKKPDAQDKDSQGPAAARAQSPAGALEGVAAASVPLYSQAQRRALAPELEAGGGAATSPEGAEATPKAPPGQFQEVPLVDPQDSRRTEVAPRERDALLGRAKSSDTGPEPAAASGSAETHGSARAGKAAEAPKHKSCQCCAVM